MPQAEKFRIALIQTHCALDQPEPGQDGSGNLAKLRRRAQIVCLKTVPLPIFLQGRNHDLFALAESIPGPSTALSANLPRVEDRDYCVVV
jgi:hypothetical protein